MIAGFLGVPFFSFAVGPILKSAGMDNIAAYLSALDVLLPSFVIGFATAIIVSTFDKQGQANLTGVKEDLQKAAA
jgi:hypothetical protein